MSIAAAHSLPTVQYVAEAGVKLSECRRADPNVTSRPRSPRNITVDDRSISFAYGTIRSKHECWRRLAYQLLSTAHCLLLGEYLQSDPGAIFH